jgi:hypothetical protein
LVDLGVGRLQQDMTISGFILERTIQVDGVVTRYLSAGTGLPLLLHVAGNNARDWSNVVPLLRCSAACWWARQGLNL